MYEAHKTPIDGLVILVPKTFPDNRGMFFEAFNKKALLDCGIEFEVCQENHVVNLNKGVFRGLHFQNDPFGQAKLVRCIKGRIFDIAVDLRKGSPTYLKWFGVELSAENKKQFYLPRGFAHGLLSLEDNTEATYFADSMWEKCADRTIRYNDKSIGIEYPIKKLILSEKDESASLLCDSDCNFTY